MLYSNYCVKVAADGVKLHEIANIIYKSYETMKKHISIENKRPDDFHQIVPR